MQTSWLPILVYCLGAAPAVTAVPGSSYLIEYAPFLMKSFGQLVDPSTVLQVLRDVDECDCLSRCLSHNQCAGYSYDTLGSNCTLNRVRGGPTTTRHSNNVHFRFRRHMAAYGDWCSTDDDCRYFTGDGVCRSSVCSCAAADHVPAGPTACVRSTTTTTTTTTPLTTTSNTTTTAPTTATPTTATETTTPGTTTTESTTTETTTTESTTTETTTTESTTTETTTTESTTTETTTTESTTTETTTTESTTTETTTTELTTTVDPDICYTALSGETGEIQSDNFPGDYEHNTDCTWVVQAPAGQTLYAVMIDFELEYHSSCDYDYLQFWDGAADSDPDLGTYCDDEIPRTIGPTSGRSLRIHFHSDNTRRYRGFHIKWAIPGELETSVVWKKSQPFSRNSYYTRTCTVDTRFNDEFIVGIQDDDDPPFSGLTSLKCRRFERFTDLTVERTSERWLSSNTPGQHCGQNEALVRLKTYREDFSNLNRFQCASLSAGYHIDTAECEDHRIDATADYSSDLGADDTWPVQCSGEFKVVVSFLYGEGDSPVYQGIRCCTLKSDTPAAVDASRAVEGADTPVTVG